MAYKTKLSWIGNVLHTLDLQQFFILEFIAIGILAKGQFFTRMKILVQITSTMSKLPLVSFHDIARKSLFVCS